MLHLTPFDIEILGQIADGLSSNDCEREKILGQITHGFATYASDEMVSKFSSREEFFRSRVDQLIGNLAYAGQTSTEAFATGDGRKYLCNLIRSMGVHSSDVEDVAQQLTRKLWKHQWAERYNPLISSWSCFTSHPVRNFVRTYHRRRKKRYLDYALSLDQDIMNGDLCNPLSRVIHDKDSWIGSEQVLLIRELLGDWEDFLNSQGAIRSTVYRGFRRYATLLPPGIPEIPTNGEIEVGFLGGGRVNSRITTLGLQEQGVTCSVPNSLLVDYIAINPETGESLIDSVTSQYVRQKFYNNLSYVESKNKIIFKRLCTLLPPGVPAYPVQEEMTLYYISKRLHVSRVSCSEWYGDGRSFSVPNELLVDYIAMDERTREPLTTGDGQEINQKFYINPDYLEANARYYNERHLLDIYQYLRDGYQIDEIAQIFKVAPASVPLWVRRLESLFRDFWLISDRIPAHMKKLAVESYKCPSCYRFYQIRSESCSHCHCDLRDVQAKIYLDAYPWPRVYGTRETMTRIESHQRVPLGMQECSV